MAGGELRDKGKQMFDQMRILMVVANELTESIDNAREQAAFVERLQAERPDFATVRVLGSASLAAFSSELSEFKPNLVHYIQGVDSARPVRSLEDGGLLTEIDGGAIADLLSRAKLSVECVFFDGCRLASATSTLARVVKNVFTVRNKVSGQSFPGLISSLFYEGLFAGQSVDSAYRSIVAELKNMGIRSEFVAYKWPFREDSRYANDDLRFSRSSPMIEPEFHLPDDVIGSQRFSLWISPPSLPKAAANPNLLASAPDARSYRVWFGTNRTMVHACPLAIEFGNTRADKISYGYCDVSIPKYHKIGELGTSWFKYFPSIFNNDRLEATAIASVLKNEFFRSLADELARANLGSRDLLVFVHGYNTRFLDAAIRAAQLGVDLNVTGATAFFAWPSQATVIGYPADEASIDASEPHIEEFILNLVERTNAERVHLIVHSMGNRAVLRALNSIAGKISTQQKLPFSQIILAAPDIDATVFKNLAAAYPKVSDRTTLYVSKQDRALKASGALHKFQRAGITPPITIVPGLDTVEVTGLDLSFLGHGYFANARAVLTDIHRLFQDNAPPGKRFGLYQIPNGGVPYWQFRK